MGDQREFSFWQKQERERMRVMEDREAGGVGQGGLGKQVKGISRFGELKNRGLFPDLTYVIKR